MKLLLKDNINLDNGIEIKDGQLASYNPGMKGTLFNKDEFGDIMFEDSRPNTVVLGGSINVLEKLYGQFAEYRPKSLNMQQSVFPPQSTVTTYDDAYEQSLENSSHVYLFGIGTGGSAFDFTNVYSPDFKQSTIMEMIPFRVSDQPTLDIPGILPGIENKVERDKYHFMKTLAVEGSSPMYGWYLKEFESTPVIQSLWKNAPNLNSDGTEITSDADLVGGPSGVGIESFAEMHLKISDDDIAPFFEAFGNINEARFNSIGIFSGSKVQLSADYYEYYNVRLVSVINIENVASKRNQHSEYAYRIYSAL